MRAINGKILQKEVNFHSLSIYSEASIVYSLPLWMGPSDMVVKCNVLLEYLVAGRTLVLRGLHVLVPHVCSHIVPLFDAPPTDEAGKSNGAGLAHGRHERLQVLFRQIYKIGTT